MNLSAPLIAFAIVVSLLAPAGSAKAQVTVTSGIKLTRTSRLKPATYQLKDAGSGVIQIGGSDMVVDCAGAKIIGPGKGVGIGIRIVDARNIIVRNADVSGYRWGIVVERSSGVKLINCRTSFNNDLKPGTVIDESGREPEDQWGGGVLLRDCRDALARGCTSQYQWDGIDVIRSSSCVIEDGDYSYNGNWGVHFWDSSHNTFRRNRAVWCTTGGGKLYQALTGWQTYDAQAVGIDHNSCDNLIEGNDLRFGGDAIFIRANEGPISPGTVVPPRNGSHRNILRDNDCSFSPNNAIEVDLVDDTVIENNNCSNSHYGMWLGYSRRCIVRRNTCVNDTAHAVEIENGQDDVFEGNVFGWDTPRGSEALVYLRQNGRDKTPSAGYKFNGNAFYGAGFGVRLRNTGVDLSGNVIDARADASAQPALAQQETPSAVREADNRFRAPSSRGSIVTFSDPANSIRPGSLITLRIRSEEAEAVPPVVEIDGIPMWVRKTAGGDPAAQESRDRRVRVWMPDDMWDRPAARNASVRVRAAGTWSSAIERAVAWHRGRPRIEGVSPNPARIGDTISLAGSGLTGGTLLLNGKSASAAGATFHLPESILVPTRYNLLWERGERDAYVRTWPISFAVEVPPAQMPHLVSAKFEPTALKVGELLKVTMTVRNNLPAAALLTMKPAPPFTYTEKEAAYEMGMDEQEGKLHLRVTSDNTAPHNPGSWPYLFGFDRPSLAPGESITVSGFIKMEHAGDREFRVGLVAGGFRFIDDNAFRTRIHVTP